jgi:hypothetical protein
MQLSDLYITVSLSVTCDRSWFSSGTPVSSTNKTERHDITQILLKVALNTINQTITVSTKKSCRKRRGWSTSQWKVRIWTDIGQPANEKSELVDRGTLVLCAKNLYFYFDILIYNRHRNFYSYNLVWSHLIKLIPIKHTLIIYHQWFVMWWVLFNLSFISLGGNDIYT